MAVPLKDSIRIKTENEQTKALDREKCFLIQTPQTFKYHILIKAFEQEEQLYFTDDATVVEQMGEKINLVAGTYFNIKITTKEDLVLGRAIYETEMNFDSNQTLV